MVFAGRFLLIEAHNLFGGLSAIDKARLTVVSDYMSVTFRDIQAAAKRIVGHVYQSPCPPSIALSEATGMNIFCKL